MTAARVILAASRKSNKGVGKGTSNTKIRAMAPRGNNMPRYCSINFKGPDCMIESSAIIQPYSFKTSPARLPAVVGRISKRSFARCLIDIGQYLGNGLIEMRRNFLTDLYLFV